MPMRLFLSSIVSYRYDGLIVPCSRRTVVPSAMDLSFIHSFLRVRVYLAHLDAVAVDDSKELGSDLSVILEDSAHGRGGCGGADLLHSAHDHAEVSAFDDDGNTQWFDGLNDGIGDLAGETLLDLQAAGEDLGNTGELGESENLAVGDVSDMDASCEWHHVMFAETVDVDVTHDDHLVVVLLEDGLVGDVLAGEVVSVCEEEEGLGPSRWRLLKALAGWVLTDAFEDGLAGLCHLGELGFLLGLGIGLGDDGGVDGGWVGHDGIVFCGVCIIEWKLNL
mmetsp:Transcript_7492/g.20239  ORF Transcript_7492/g.20239 Transcript_7492/m.20239 type:complete len:278 (-) Transcript_7492:320-1153(-)|eukprot:CAMPEP_0198113084 /NCGR_PEP_ID=MMETSP1442-20131203/4827_1 /TAXON_ID= /ORGANISM="Craspedostauros australis, Strain CCMP3328" /LENGTH=277 /DNA_ID=CAMNT_0043770075 /DNA_START=96 /DNA_END=929 /DNA_ORIENTATION=+